MDGQQIRAGEIEEALNRLTTRNLDISVLGEPKPTPENRVTLDTQLRNHFGQPGGSLHQSETEEDVRTMEWGTRSHDESMDDSGSERFRSYPGVQGCTITWGLAGWRESTSERGGSRPTRAWNAQSVCRR